MSSSVYFKQGNGQWVLNLSAWNSKWCKGHKTHRAKAQNGVDVRVIFFNLFSEPHRLVIFLGVNVLGPAALEVVHTLAYILGSKCIDLKRKTGKVSILVGSNRIVWARHLDMNDVRESLHPPVLTSWCESSADTWIERLTGFLSM